MNKGRILLVVLAALVPASAQTAQEESPQEAVERLGSPDADVREAAAAKLLKLGDAARPVLEKAVRSRDPEVAIRARGVLAKLDAKRDLPTRRRRLAGHSGFLKDDDLHLMWIEKPAFDLLADEALFPEQWRTDDERLKKYLEEKTRGDGEAAPFFDSFRLALIEMQEGRIKASELVEVSRTADGEAFILNHRYIAYDPKPNGGSGEEESISVSPGSRRIQASTWTSLFALWPRLRRCSIAFVGRGCSSMTHGLQAALDHDRAIVRAAAVHALQHHFSTNTVELALKKLEDRDELVRDAARQTLKAVAGASPGDGDNLRIWWQGLKGDQQLRIVKKRFDESGTNPGTLHCCDD